MHNMSKLTNDNKPIGTMLSIKNMITKDSKSKRNTQIILNSNDKQTTQKSKHIKFNITKQKRIIKLF